jgi:hypothetical protein
VINVREKSMMKDFDKVKERASHNIVLGEDDIK